MNSEKAEAIVKRLLTNAEGLRYGAASVLVKLHDGRITQICYETTESTKETESPLNDKAGGREM